MAACEQKSMNALQQIMARNGKPIVICTEVRPPLKMGLFAAVGQCYVLSHQSSFCGTPQQGDAKSLKGVKHVIEIPPIADCLAGILAVLPFQLISYHLAVARGYNVRGTPAVSTGAAAN